LSGGKKGDCHNCSVLCCVLKLCTLNSHKHTSDEQFLQFLGLGFVTLGPFHCAEIYLCLSMFHCICVVLLWAWCSWWDWSL